MNEFTHTRPGAADRAGAVLTIDTGALARNYTLLRKRCVAANEQADCAAVVKADAYGTGARMAVPALLKAGCRRFFVAQLDEALQIADLLPEGAVVGVLNGFDPREHGGLPHAGIMPVVNHPGALAQWREYAAMLGDALDIMLHVDTGMNRLGFSAQEVAATSQATGSFDGLNVHYILSHLACADEPGHPMNAEQLKRLRAALERLPAAPVSFANSAGVLLGGDYVFDLGRPGVALYGGNPMVDNADPQNNPMEHVVTLKARVLQLRDVAAGMSVGYGATYTARSDMQTATLALGYADGYLRHLSNNTVAYYNGVALPVIGRVSMDLVTLDVSPLSGGGAKSGLRAGDYVEILGANHNVDALARDAGTIGYEILTSLGRRYHREYL